MSVFGVPPDDRRAPTAAAAYDHAAERLLDALLAAWRPRASFPAQVQALLGAALDHLAASPEAAYALTVWPFAGDDEVLDRHIRWQQRFADLLRTAASRYGETRVHPPFFEPSVIAGLNWQVSRQLRAEGPARLADLQPMLTEFLLACYLPSGPSPSLASAAPWE